MKDHWGRLEHPCKCCSRSCSIQWHLNEVDWDIYAQTTAHKLVEERTFPLARWRSDAQSGKRINCLLKLKFLTLDTAARKNAAWCSPSKWSFFGSRTIITRFLISTWVCSPLIFFKHQYSLSSLIFPCWNKRLISRLHSVRIIVAHEYAQHSKLVSPLWTIKIW